MPVPSDELRVAMRAWATGVTVVAAQYENILHGMTVSSFTSASLKPPLVLVSLEIGTRTHQFVEKAGTFGITILAHHSKRSLTASPTPIPIWEIALQTGKSSGWKLVRRSSSAVWLFSIAGW